jgi:hypothetical protein
MTVVEMHIPGLGGLRRRMPNSPNTGWRNASFQAYADYMLTPEFEKSLDELARRAIGERAALICAEAVPWRCHRSLIADALVVRGIPMQDIFTAGRTQPHVLRSFAHVEGTRITYSRRQTSCRTTPDVRIRLNADRILNEGDSESCPEPWRRNWSRLLSKPGSSEFTASSVTASTR